MTFVLFHLESGTAIAQYETESEARKGMRSSNENAGWVRYGISFHDGFECELANNGSFSSRAPYGITEYERWEDKFAVLGLSVR